MLFLVRGEIMYPNITIFNKEITTYTLMTLVGVLVVGFLCVRRCKKYSFDDNKMIVLLLFGALGAFIGRHLLYGLVNLPLIIQVFLHIDEIESYQTIIEIIQVIFGGSVFYGGLYGGILASYLYVRKAKLDVKMASYIATPFIPLFHFFGRIGCFLYGCCFGVESKWGILYHNHLFDLEPVRRFPVQLLEAGFNLVIFFLLLWLEKKGKFKNSILVLYLFIYALGRFFLEFLRGDTYRGIYFGLSTSQWISIVTILGCVIYYFIKRKKRV